MARAGKRSDSESGGAVFPRAAGRFDVRDDGEDRGGVEEEGV